MTRSTGEVARYLSHQIGRAITERQINALLRRRPDLSPSIIAGRRAWRAPDVAAMQEFLAARSSQSGV